MLIFLYITFLIQNFSFAGTSNYEIFEEQDGKKYLEWVIPIKNGLVDGEVSRYSSKGEKIQSQVYSLGIKQGPGFIFDSWNNKKYDFFFKDGLLNGVYKVNGKITKKYVMGQLANLVQLEKKLASNIDSKSRLINLMDIINFECVSGTYINETGDFVGETFKFVKEGQDLRVQHYIHEGSPAQIPTYTYKVTNNEKSYLPGFVSFIESETKGESNAKNIVFFKAISTKKSKLKILTYTRSLPPIPDAPIQSHSLKNSDLIRSFYRTPGRENQLSELEEIDCKIK